MDAADVSIVTMVQTVRDWGGWTLLFAAVIWWIRGAPERRRADTEADKTLHHDQALHIDSLRKENVGLRERVEAVENSRFEDRKKCQEENDELRAMVRELQDTVQGLRRDIAQNSNSTAHILGDLTGGAAA